MPRSKYNKRPRPGRTIAGGNVTIGDTGGGDNDGHLFSNSLHANMFRCRCESCVDDMSAYQDRHMLPDTQEILVDGKIKDRTLHNWRQGAANCGIESEIMLCKTNEDFWKFMSNRKDLMSPPRDWSRFHEKSEGWDGQGWLNYGGAVRCGDIKDIVAWGGLAKLSEIYDVGRTKDGKSRCDIPLSILLKTMENFRDFIKYNANKRLRSVKYLSCIVKVLEEDWKPLRVIKDRKTGEEFWEPREKGCAFLCEIDSSKRFAGGKWEGLAAARFCKFVVENEIRDMFNVVKFVDAACKNDIPLMLKRGEEIKAHALDVMFKVEALGAGGFGEGFYEDMCFEMKEQQDNLNHMGRMFTGVEWGGEEGEVSLLGWS